MAKWAMVIDLNKCTGCGDCVAACKIENNIAVSTPEEAAAGRAMFWMDMVTVYEGEYPEIKIKRFPKPCYHCENPPCVKVCPVHATYKNEEGIVGQIYERCIGCRYCMAGCPFTAKIFNWYEPEWPDEYKRCFNPDVFPRKVGVVEKCSFCAHRLIKVKEEVDLEEREIKDGEYATACMESCPTKAIYFGDLDNKKSQVYELSRSSRAYKELEDLGVKPKVIYLSEKDT